MKLILYFCVLAAAISFGNCKKQQNKTADVPKNRPGGFIENKTVAVNNCVAFLQNSINYTICLDSVTNESRCPNGAQCIWQGYAKAKFSFTAGPATHHFSLYTLIQNGANPLPNDTTINDIKIRLVNLTPYPDLAVPLNYGDYKTDITITQQ